MQEPLAAVLPAVWHELQEAAGVLERAFGDMQDFEFTVQDGHLYLLQARTGRRSRRAAARIALDLLKEGIIDAAQARERTAGLDRAALAQTRVVNARGERPAPLAQAASASPGVAIGEIALDAARAQARRQSGAQVVLVRRDAETSDVAALEIATGLLSQRGARTSHAAVVGRQLGKVCLVGCTALQIDEVGRAIRLGEAMLREGEILSLDGNEGLVYAGAVRTELEVPEDLLERLAALHGGRP
jgi:pyruvate,orthophosphate dikinase